MGSLERKPSPESTEPGQTKLNAKLILGICVNEYSPKTIPDQIMARSLPMPKIKVTCQTFQTGEHKQTQGQMDDSG